MKLTVHLEIWFSCSLLRPSGLCNPKPGHIWNQINYSYDIILSFEVRSSRGSKALRLRESKQMKTKRSQVCSPAWEIFFNLRQRIKDMVSLQTKYCCLDSNLRLCFLYSMLPPPEPWSYLLRHNDKIEKFTLLIASLGSRIWNFDNQNISHF